MELNNFAQNQIEYAQKYGLGGIAIYPWNFGAEFIAEISHLNTVFLKSFYFIYIQIR